MMNDERERQIEERQREREEHYRARQEHRRELREWRRSDPIGPIIGALVLIWLGLVLLAAQNFLGQCLGAFSRRAGRVVDLGCVPARRFLYSSAHRGAADLGLYPSGGRDGRPFPRHGRGKALAVGSHRRRPGLAAHKYLAAIADHASVDLRRYLELRADAPDRKPVEELIQKLEAQR
jgi:hypothetical protein